MLHGISRLYQQLLFLFLCSTIIISCSQSDTKKKETMQQTKSAPYKKPPSSFTDTLIIEGPAAVFFNSDTVQLQKIKAIIDQEIFESTMHDCFFQQRNAKQVLKKYWSHIRVIEASDKQFLLFLEKNQQRVYTNLNEINDMCGLILFKNGKTPEIADMMNIETALHNYFYE
ncbi:hypothetical protein CAP36_08495 [Chitinophagaceae bacterium IBVUCB2]|nr:hypothetical protein CAP36_08495 [Chitinophagaceae bacterium IBVUCB2]